MTAYANLAIEVGITPAVSAEKFKRWFVWMGLQRHIKVLGIFCRLSLRDNKHHYLNDLPMVVRYVRVALEQYSELAEFSLWFESTLMPIINKQDWMLNSVQETRA
jgi:aminoglycoside/choline kinase family phosphotransferase